jgi:hypothetical protein
MSLLLHLLAKVIFFTVLGVVVLTLLRWFTKTTGSDQIPPPASGEWPEDKATQGNRVAARRPYASSRRDLQDEQERRRA